ncbi:C1QL4-like protein, partial [Mya arenaria]
MSAVIRPVAFTATLGHNIATLGKQQAIIYEEVTLNLGDAYDVRHGIFTAPFAGLYEFTAVVLNRGGVSTGLSLVLNGEAVTKVQSGDSSYYTMGTNAVALKLVAGDEVWVRHTDQSDSNSIQGESTSSFTGYLIDDNIAVEVVPVVRYDPEVDINHDLVVDLNLADKHELVVDLNLEVRHDLVVGVILNGGYDLAISNLELTNEPLFPFTGVSKALVLGTGEGKGLLDLTDRVDLADRCERGAVWVLYDLARDSPSSLWFSISSRMSSSSNSSLRDLRIMSSDSLWMVRSAGLPFLIDFLPDMLPLRDSRADDIEPRLSGRWGRLLRL